MYLERLLQINIATLTTLGALLLGMGQRSVGPPLIVALAAAGSIWLTDITGWLRLKRGAANGLMLLAAAVSLRQLYPITSELQTLNFAWFLIYLQAILFFQPKDERTYWLLVMFSLLQVIVATLFSQGVWFGVLLAAYMLLGFAAMTLLLLYRQWQPQQAFDGRHVDAPWRFVLQMFRRSDAAQIPTAGPASPPTVALRWPLRAWTTDLVAQPGGDDRAGVDARLFRRLGRMALYTGILTTMLFFALPRFGHTTWRGVGGSPQEMVGYSDAVELGELGQIIDNPQRVMTVRFFDPATNDSQPITSEIYLQGAILMTYEGGHWQAGLPSWDMRTRLLEPEEEMPAHFVRQEFVIESMDHEELFFVAPLIALEGTHEMSYDYGRQRLLRFGPLRERQFGYKLGTTAIVRGVQKPLAPSYHRDSTQRALQFPKQDNVRALPNLVALANRWIAESGLPSSDQIGRARYLEQKFLTSSEFQYSAVGQQRDPDLDPIEDFVSLHRQGHCEYFASALALMLRSQDIPARVIVGYKCDEWNSQGGYYQVRQLHAHTWVEAFLRFPQIPPELLHGRDVWNWEEEGGWLRLDPTPGGIRAPPKASVFAPISHAADWLDSVWSKYVVELDYKRQYEAIYGPIWNTAKAAFQFIADVARWRERIRRLSAVLCLDEASGVVAWTIVLATLAFLAAFAASVAWLLVRGWHFWRRRVAGNGTRRARDRQAEVEFYRRFEAILARHRLVRRPSQTQWDFAEEAGGQLAAAAGKPHLVRQAGIVAEAYYRVRFGRQPLDNRQGEEVEHALGDLATTAPSHS